MDIIKLILLAAGASASQQKLGPLPPPWCTSAPVWRPWLEQPMCRKLPVGQFLKNNKLAAQRFALEDLADAKRSGNEAKIRQLEKQLAEMCICNARDDEIIRMKKAGESLSVLQGMRLSKMKKKAEISLKELSPPVEIEKEKSFILSAAVKHAICLYFVYATID